MLRNGATTTLYKIYGNGVWRTLGAVYPPLRAITGFDSLLFGIRDGYLDHLDLASKIT